MKPLSISFIIPYYKVELALLARAIRSVQALGNTVDWEIWVIDDGTPESEAKHFIEQLNEPNIGYYAQTHSGPGGARNTGLDLANKEYVHFLDADDYLFHTPLVTGNHSDNEFLLCFKILLCIKYQLTCMIIVPYFFNGSAIPF